MAGKTDHRFTIEWSSPIIVNDLPVFTDRGQDAQKIHSGRYGSEYARMLKLQDGRWMIVYTILDNFGYRNEPAGGCRLQFAVSSDNCRTWEVISRIEDPGRDLDNGQLIQLKTGEILASCRSVRWQESYELHVYKSSDLGRTWSFLSKIDENHGAPGELGKPDKGIYEPHFCFLDDGRLSVMYANEKHVVEEIPYSQIISQKISDDEGASWGDEILVAWDTNVPAARPGMPVSTKMDDGRFIAVFEICGTEDADIFYKYSADGFHWVEGNGIRIPGQKGGPYIAALSDGTLLVTSNIHNVSVSKDLGRTWYLISDSPWDSFFNRDTTVPHKSGNLWPSLYNLENGEIAFITSVAREEGGHNVQIRFGRLLSGC